MSFLLRLTFLLPLVALLSSEPRTCFHAGVSDPHEAMVFIAYYWSDMTDEYHLDSKALCGRIDRRKPMEPFVATWYGDNGSQTSGKFLGLPNAIKFVEAHCPTK